MQILIFDNYDSFTFNLFHLIEKHTDAKIEVHRNDKISLEQISEFDRIIISPGPGIPSEAGLLIPMIKKFGPEKPILGVCLGHQGIAEAFGGKLINLDKVFHGVSTPIEIVEEDPVFKGLPKKIMAGRYHSWVVERDTLPNDFIITSLDSNGQIMSMRHKNHDITSVQFHPESILTEHGETILKNWLEK